MIFKLVFSVVGLSHLNEMKFYSNSGEISFWKLNSLFGLLIGLVLQAKDFTITLWSILVIVQIVYSSITRSLDLDCSTVLKWLNPLMVVLEIILCMNQYSFNVVHVHLLYFKMICKLAAVIYSFAMVC